MKLSILTLFPDFFSTPLRTSMLKRATENQIIDYQVIDIRQFAADKHQTTDDRPYGGGPGMVMKVEPIFAALKSVLGADPAQLKLNRQQIPSSTRVILTSAKGKRFTQASARLYAELDHLVIICGHYEGVDERVSQYLIDEEVRIGDYVLTGGEPAALVMADAVSRLIPGVLGNETSIDQESHTEPGYFAHPQYTRPPVFQGWTIPQVLLEGNHAQINQWRAEQSVHAARLVESTATQTATPEEVSE